MWKPTAVVLVCFAAGVLSLSSSPPLSSTASTDTIAGSWRLRTAVSTLQGIRGRDGSEKNDGPLDLLHDFHDQATGLCSEGVWHNSMLGIALVKASQRLREEPDSEVLANEYRDWARRLATNLFDLNFVPGKGFRRRSSSGIWGTIERNEEAKVEDGEFYKPGDERMCISNAAAVLFMTYVREEFPNDGGVSSMAAECGDAFVGEFFDRNQGRFLYAAGEEGGPWRAADQALGILACLRLLRDMKAQVDEGSIPRRKLFETRTMAANAAESLLDDFGYGAYATEGLTSPVNTIGATAIGEIPNYRNSWHDSLACFAILASNATSGRESPIGLCRFMARDYGIISNEEDDSDINGRQILMAHDTQENRFLDGPNAYTCTQAIWDACRRAVEVNIAGFVDFRHGLQSFHEKSSVREKEGALSTVGTAYPMVRLWANTELAAWLLIDAADFAI